MTKSVEQLKNLAREIGVPLKEISRGRYEMISERGGIMRGSKDDVEKYLVMRAYLIKLRRERKK